MGNSQPEDPIKRTKTVHPHVHGELPFLIKREVLPRGSSPRAWGTHAVREMNKDNARFIPTCMGNSLRTEAFL